jgi:hypothetical protein
MVTLLAQYTTKSNTARIMVTEGFSVAEHGFRVSTA